MAARTLQALCLVALAGLSCSALDPPGPAPRSLEPARGWSGARTAVVIRGDGFLARTTRSASGDVEVEVAHRAWLAGVELEEVVRVDPHTLRATVPAGLPAGPQPLVVENAFGQRGALDAAFEVVDAPGAVLSATLKPAAALATVGQELAVRATVANLGSATAHGVTAAVVPAPAGGRVRLSGPTPAVVEALAPGESVTFVWSCLAIAPGEVSIAASGTATDELSGLAVESPAARAALDIQLPAGLVATVVAARATAGAGQQVAVDFTVTNGGGAAAELTEITPSAGPAPDATCGAPVPSAPRTVGVGESATFAWTCAASEPGELLLGGTAAGTDVVSGAALSATALSPAVVAVQTPATLAATLSLPAGSATASVGQQLELTLVVVNEGDADAEVTGVVPTVTPGGASGCGAPRPTLPRRVSGGASATFLWTCTPAVPGSVTFGALVSGLDGNTGVPLAVSPGEGATTIVQLPAALAAVVSARPSVASVGQPVAVTFTVVNGGTATANVTSVVPSAAGAAAASCGAVAPSPPRAVSAGQAVAFAWTCTPSAPGELALSGTASGTDANSGAPLLARPAGAAAVTVQRPAALRVTAFTSSGGSVAVGQPVAVTLTLANDGGAAATVRALAPSMSPSTSGSCSAPTPLPPVAIAGAASRTFTWSCAGSAPGGYHLGASVAAEDANSAAALPLSLPERHLDVRAPVRPAAAVVTERDVVTTGQAVAVSFTVVNGEAAATVTSVRSSATGPSATCGPATPSDPQALAAGESRVYRWTCTPAAAGVLQLSGVAEGEEGQGAPFSAIPATPAAVTVQDPPALVEASFDVTRTSASLGQEVGVSLTLRNLGGATAAVSAVVPTVAPEANATCTASSPAPPPPVPGGGAVTFGWSCTGAVPGIASLGAAITAVDANTNAPAAAEVTPIAVVFEAPAALAATSFSTEPATPTAGEPFAVTLVLSSTGGAGAEVRAVSRSATPEATLDCTPAAPEPPRTIPGGESLAFGWTCTASDAGDYTLLATVSATDANTGSALDVTVPPLVVTVAQAHGGDSEPSPSPQ